MTSGTESDFHHPSNDHPPILVVPESERARTFDSLAKSIRHYPGCPVEQLRVFINDNPKMPVKVIPSNAENAALMMEAGVALAGRGLR
jgi:hypothetical protein